MCHSQNMCEVTLVGSLKPFCPVHMVSQIQILYEAKPEPYFVYKTTFHLYRLK